MSNKDLFKDIVFRYIKRNGIKQLMDNLEKTDFYKAPASTKHHESYEGGLVEHSLNVFNQIMKENTLLDKKYDTETLAIVSLFHDVCKVGYYEVSMRNTKDESGKWIQVPFYTVNDKFPFGHGEKSVFMINQFLELTEDEVLAIRWHMNGFEPKENYQYMSKAYSEVPLAVILATADLKATYIK